MEKENKLKKIKLLQQEIEDSFTKIKEIIQKKINDCLQEANDLIDWSIRDTEDELFSKPMQWFYMPIYVMFIEDKSSMEERMLMILPGYVGTKDKLYEDLSESFAEFKNIIFECVENDMRIRSNFEFSTENKSILREPNFKQQIQMGISILKNKGLMSEQIEKSINEKIDLIA
jgi:hypothetical protein